MTRRTLIGAAWSAPIIAAATAAPLAAASTTPLLTISFTPTVIEMNAFSGDEREASSALSIQNNSDATVTEPVTVFTVGSLPFFYSGLVTSPGWDFYSGGGDVFGVTYSGAIPAGATVTSDLLLFSGESAAGATNTITWTVLNAPSIQTVTQMVAV